MTQPIRAVLFDLDGTLLENNVPVFFDNYFRRLAGCAAHLLPPQAFIAHLNAAVDAMLANDGVRTNAQVFADAFYPRLGSPREEVEPLFLDFYAREFPKLQQFTAPKPDARRVVARAFELGLEVVLATNPLFPETAICQRMQWAGIADFPFRLVTTYENSHASKPNLRYYQQIADHLNLPPAACLMVGDEDWDMVAAHLGCLTYLVPGVNSTPMLKDAPQPHYQGSLGELIGVLESLHAQV